MFKSHRVPCYLNSFGGHGDDPDNKELKLIFHVMAIGIELATEISPFVADRIFRNVAGEWEQAREVSKISFSNISVPMQNVKFFPVPAEALLDESALVLGAAISNVRAARDINGIRLEFDMVIPMDHLTMELVQKYYKSTCFLTMETSQRQLEVTVTAGSEDFHKDLQDVADAETIPQDSKSAAAGDDTGAYVNAKHSRKRKKD